MAYEETRGEPVYKENRDYISVDVMGTITGAPRVNGFFLVNERDGKKLEFKIVIRSDLADKYKDIFREGDYVFISKAGLFMMQDSMCLAITQGSYISLVKRNNNLGTVDLKETFL